MGQISVIFKRQFYSIWQVYLLVLIPSKYWMSMDGSSEREFDMYNKEGFPRADAEGISISPKARVSQILQDSTEKQNICWTPRREVWWLDLGPKNQSLIESIKQRFEDYLDRFLSFSSNSLLRHITSPMDSKLRHHLHQCPGFLREEITYRQKLAAQQRHRTLVNMNRLGK